jgi:hypothetical protein
MDSISERMRGGAALIALVAWAGLALQFQSSLVEVGSLGATAWILLRFFTVITNLVVAIVFTGVALGRARFAAPRLLGGVCLAIMLVGVVYNLLLRGLAQLSGGAWVADLLMHQVTPVACVLFWLAFAPKGGFRGRDPLVWALFPLAYFVYALARGSVEGIYAYPFLDVGRIGWTHTLVNGAAIAAGFILTGYLMVWLDGRLARRAVAVGGVTRA